MIENALEDPRDPSLLNGRSFGRKVLSNVVLRHLRQYSLEDEIVSLVKMAGLSEEHNEELTTEKLIELHCISQQEVTEESLSEEEEVTAKQQSSSAVFPNPWGVLLVGLGTLVKNRNQG
ncbi:hypothetical protein AVEN_5492-1 [Araneus ventricosus]|uniref:Uncharacterized protein n=1 Tax=Araneus ventricosus TaxID=182803 RepID=A0A4Y2JRB4_ARAVE|nr:hypothetical protein AVEN_5492-1 [Araneus ventricosus]